MQFQISKWGNSLAMRLPGEVVRRLGLRVGDRIEAEVAPDGALMIRPVGWSRRAFAAELKVSRKSLPIGRPVVEEMRSQERY